MNHTMGAVCMNWRLKKCAIFAAGCIQNHGQSRKNIPNAIVMTMKSNGIKDKCDRRRGEETIIYNAMGIITKTPLNFINRVKPTSVPVITACLRDGFNHMVERMQISHMTVSAKSMEEILAK